MTISPESVALIRASFAQLPAETGNLGRLFYKHLFDRAPQLRNFFAPDIGLQARRLEQMIMMLAKGLNSIGQVIPQVRALGFRHAAYGVAPEHFTVVGESLMVALEASLGDAFDEPTRAAWAEVYGVIAAEMQSAMHLAS